MANSAGFWDRIANRYSKNPVRDEETYRKKLEITRQYFSPSSEVLEFGCGTGSTALVHAPYVKHILAIDFSQKMIEIAEGKRQDAGIDNVTFECRTLEEIDREAAYDAVLGLNVVHLLPDWRATLARVGKLLKPKGVFVSSTACINDFMPLIRYIHPIGRLVRLLPDLAFFSSAEFNDALRATGFEIEHEWLPNKRAALFTVARKRD